MRSRMVDGIVKRIVIEVDAGEPINGSIADQTGDSEAFTGWLELTSKLERMRKGKAQSHADGLTPS